MVSFVHCNDRELSKELRCNVMGYDYTGYGCSIGQPSVTASIGNLEAAYTCLLQRCVHLGMHSACDAGV